MPQNNSDDQKIEAVARVLLEWNPLGDDAQRVHDLDGYRTEAIDILRVARVGKLEEGCKNCNGNAKRCT